MRNPRAETWISATRVSATRSNAVSAVMPPPAMTTLPSRALRTSRASMGAPSDAVGAPPLVRTRSHPRSNATSTATSIVRATSTARWNVTDLPAQASTSLCRSVTSTSPSGVSTPTTRPWAPRPTAVRDVAEHHGLLVPVEDEAAATGPDHDVHRRAVRLGELEHRLDGAGRGGRAALGIVLAQLDAVSAPQEGQPRRADGGGQDLDGRSEMTHGPSIGQNLLTCGFIWAVTMPATS